MRIKLNNIITGDCLEELKKLESNSVDSVVTDPPYGLGFMDKSWDTFDKNQFGKAGEEVVNDLKVKKNFKIFPRYCSDGLYDFTKSWAIECLRVLKPGGYLLSFSGTRTYHKICMGIEDAGFEIRDMISWLYGSGFPKSHNVGKAVDKLLGNEREIIGNKKGQGNIPNDRGNWGLKSNSDVVVDKGHTAWGGWGTALKPACEPIVVARKPLIEKTVAANVLKYGTGGINIDACRIETKGEKVDIHHTKGASMFNKGDYKEINRFKSTQGRFPANIILDEEAGRMLDEQSGISKSSDAIRNNNNNLKNYTCYGNFKDIKTKGFKDKGGASRFFKNIKNEKVYICSLCNNTYTKEVKKECLNINVNNVEKNLETTQVIKENIVQQNAMLNLNKKLDQIVKCVGNLCQKCATSIVQDIVKIKNLDSKKEELKVIQDFIGNYKKCILIQNLVDYVEKWDNIDTTQTTQNLLKLFGYVNRVIINYTQEIEKSEPKRFLYQAKASKSERNKGLDNIQEKRKAGAEFRPNHMEKALKGEDGNPFGRWGEIKNIHPTVKPVKLMEYLIRLVTKPGGTVLDPFTGSGTTGVASINLGYSFVGIEREKEYVKIASARIDSALKDMEEKDKQKRLL